MNNMSNHQIQEAANAIHPVIGFISMVIILITSYVVGATIPQIPVIVMQLFQLSAWTVTICVGLYTLRPWIKERFKKKTKKKKNG